MAGTLIKKGAKVLYSILDGNVTVEEGAVVGDPQDAGKGIAVLGRQITIGRNAKVDGGKILDQDYKGE